ncbi:MAG: hypothetical protein WA876_16340 [Candidatus Acidiferrales bacterium]
MRKVSIVLITALTVAVLGGMSLRRRTTTATSPPLPPRPLLDKYGGSPQLRCANKTGHFTLTKIDNRWWFCDPSGNAFISMSVGNIVTNGNPTKDCTGANTYPIYAAKYGDTNYNWGWQTLKRMTTWGFNSVGQDSGGSAMPWQTCSNCVWPRGKQPIQLPYISEPKPAEYASINEFGYLTSPIKDEISGTNNNYTAWRGGALFDVFDPGLNTEWVKELQSTQISVRQILTNSPYLLDIFTDDSDYFIGSGAGPDFFSGHTSANMAWVTLITSPVQTYIQATPQGSRTLLYSSTKNYSKSLATNPTTTCSISNPCSLRDYLWQKYKGSIANLNAAWGSNYTTFDSTGTKVSGEEIGAGDGVKKVFTYQLTHAAVSPYSVLIFENGVARAGDCPWFHRACITRSKNRGTIGSPTANYIAQALSTIDYSTGAVSISFANPPAKGTAITLDYIYKGWMAGGTGLMDEDGSNGGTGHNSSAWVGTNALCLEGADPNYPTYFSCRGAGSDPVPDANPALGADLDNWVAQMAAKYFKTMHDDLKAVSHVPYFGLDTMGSWGSPAYSKFMEGAAPYLDGAFVDLTSWAPAPSPALFQSAYQYLTKYLGDIPLMDFTVIAAQSDSSFYCNALNSPNNMANQAIRGKMWYNTVQYLLNTPGYNGDTQFVGFDWWSWQDFQGENQGLVSIHDNAYDGHEDVPGKVPCSPPNEALACGGETSAYGDLISEVEQANAIWLSLASKNAAPASSSVPPREHSQGQKALPAAAADTERKP